MLKISDRLFLAVDYDGKEFPIEKFTIKSLMLTENVNLHLPCGQIVFSDNNGLLSQSPLEDNKTFKIFIATADNRKFSDVYNMRVLKTKKTKSGNIDYFTVYLIFDAPRFLVENENGVYENLTSEQVMEKVAASCGLTYSPDKTVSRTVDRQSWYPRGDRRCIFSRKVCNAAYADEKSCFQMGVTLNGFLKFTNVAELKFSDSTTFFTNAKLTGEDKYGYPFISKKEFSNSGTANTMNGYRLESVEQTPTAGKSADAKRNSKVKATAIGGGAGMNENINKGIDGSRVQFAPINTGNVHPNYEKARHQNQRLLGLFSTGVYFVCTATIDVNILDPIKLKIFTIDSGKQSLDQSASGNYVVTAKAIYIDGSGKYYEKYQVMRQQQKKG